MWATQVDRALWLAAQQPSPSPAARAVWLLRRQKRDRAADRVSGRSGPPSVTDVHTCTRNDCPRVRSCFVRVTDTLYFPCREQSPNSAEQQPLNADAASAPPHNGAREGGPVSPSLVKYLPWLYALPMLLKAVRGSSTVSSRRPVARADRTDHVHAVSEDERRAFLRVAKHILHQMIILVAPAPEEAKR